MQGRVNGGAGGRVNGGASYLRRTPPRMEALRHSGGQRRRCTSATVTLYLALEERSERRPGTEQKGSEGGMCPKRFSLKLSPSLPATLDANRGRGNGGGEAGTKGTENGV